MTGKMPRIGLIHAVQASMAPVLQVFGEYWPEASLMNVLDDSLPVDLQRAGGIDRTMMLRFERLSGYCFDQGADAILFTCSAFGPAIEQAATKLPIPVLKPNEAMFEKACAGGRKVGMLATFPPAVATMEAEFYRGAEKIGCDAKIDTVCLPEAMDAARAGDYARHNRILVDALPRFKDVDVLLLAQFSMTPAIGEIQKNIPVPVLSSPHAAVEKLKSLLSPPN